MIDKTKGAAVVSGAPLEKENLAAANPSTAAQPRQDQTHQKLTSTRAAICAGGGCRAVAATAHVARPSGNQERLCPRHWRAAQADAAREAVRRDFHALFRLRPLVARPGGAIGALAMRSARIGAEGGAAA